MAKLKNVGSGTWSMPTGEYGPDDVPKTIDVRKGESRNFSAEEMKSPHVRAAMHVSLLVEERASAASGAAAAKNHK